MRDMTCKQFDKACHQYGFVREGFGYYRLPEPFQNVSVYASNAGNNRRAGLAYLLHELEREQKTRLWEREAKG